MRAMVLHAVGQPLVAEERPDPLPAPGEVRLRVEACAVCRTDLHAVDGDLSDPKLPLVPGHEIVGIVDRVGAGVTRIVSVANLTRADATEFLAIAPRAGVRTTTHAYRLDQANEAFADLRAGRFQGAGVLVP